MLWPMQGAVYMKWQKQCKNDYYKFKEICSSALIQIRGNPVNDCDVFRVCNFLSD